MLLLIFLLWIPIGSDPQMNAKITNEKAPYYNQEFAYCAPPLENGSNFDFDEPYELGVFTPASSTQKQYVLLASAVEYGRVVYIGWSLFTGTYVIIVSHGSDTFSTYSVSKYAWLVKCGEIVHRSQRLGGVVDDVGIFDLSRFDKHLEIVR